MLQENGINISKQVIKNLSKKTGEIGQNLQEHIASPKGLKSILRNCNISWLSAGSPAAHDLMESSDLCWTRNTKGKHSHRYIQTPEQNSKVKKIIKLLMNAVS